MQFGQANVYVQQGNPGGQPILQATLVKVCTDNGQGKQPPAGVLWNKPGCFGGASGSLLFTLQGQLVGLHYAGTTSGSHGYHIGHDRLVQLAEEARLMIVGLDEERMLTERAGLVSRSPVNKDSAPAAEHAKQQAMQGLGELSVGWDIVRGHA